MCASREGFSGVSGLQRGKRRLNGAFDQLPSAFYISYFENLESRAHQDRTAGGRVVAGNATGDAVLPPLRLRKRSGEDDGKPSWAKACHAIESTERLYDAWSQNLVELLERSGLTRPATGVETGQIDDHDAYGSSPELVLHFEEKPTFIEQFRCRIGDVGLPRVFHQ